jgi:hypothetical protein
MDFDAEGLSGLIRALTILRKYGNPDYPTHCEPDMLVICGICPIDVDADDIRRLETLGFIVSDSGRGGDSYFCSFRYGSA